MGLKMLLVDDEPLARARLRTLLAECQSPAAEVAGEAANAAQAMEHLRRQSFDAVLLDIHMPGADGLALAQVLRSLPESPPVVFVTAYAEHAVDAFRLRALDYLLKPVDDQRFREALGRVRERLRSARDGALGRRVRAALDQPEEPTPAAARRPADRIAVKSNGRIRLVAAEEIDWVEADGDHLRLHAGRAVHTLRETMAELEARLRGFRFVRVHRSAIVNVDAVRAVEPIAKGDYFLVLRDGTRVRSGRRYRGDVQALMR